MTDWPSSRARSLSLFDIANTQPFSEYYSAIRTYSVIRVYMFSSYNIIRVVKYEYDEYNTINFEYVQRRFHDIKLSIKYYEYYSILLISDL